MGCGPKLPPNSTGLDSEVRKSRRAGFRHPNSERPTVMDLGTLVVLRWDVPPLLQRTQGNPRSIANHCHQVATTTTFWVTGVASYQLQGSKLKATESPCPRLSGRCFLLRSFLLTGASTSVCHPISSTENTSGRRTQ